MALKLVLLLSYVSLLYARSTINTRASGVADQTCDGTSRANSEFYCPYDGKCKARSLRCIGANVCNNPATNSEEGCYETSIPGKYGVRLGHSTFIIPKTTSGGVEHQFIEYRGFTYEFGRTYGVQILDTADPLYKYKNGKELNSQGIEDVGSSYCTWQDATLFTERWLNSYNYNLLSSNCQDFARTLRVLLTTGVCSQLPSSVTNRMVALNEHITNTITACKDNTNYAVIIGIPSGIGIVLVIVVFLILAYCIYRCCCKKKSTDKKNNNR